MHVEFCKAATQKVLKVDKQETNAYFSFKIEIKMNETQINKTKIFDLLVAIQW